jgi:hypothetical protein
MLFVLVEKSIENMFIAQNNGFALILFRPIKYTLVCNVSLELAKEAKHKTLHYRVGGIWID